MLTTFFFRHLSINLFQHNITMARKKKPSSLIIRYSTDQSSSLLFKLPPELRVAICEYVATDTELSFGGRSGNTGRKKHGRTVWIHGGKPNPPRLVLTCKQVYQESIGIFYSHARFEFWKLVPFRHWLRTISDENLNAVQRVVIIQSMYQHHLMSKTTLQCSQQPLNIHQSHRIVSNWQTEHAKYVSGDGSIFPVPIF